MSLNPLKHLALIMDGNGRWALNMGKPRVFGHAEGMLTARKIVSYVSEMTDISHLTLFVLSTENSLRPKEELSHLVKLLYKALSEEVSFLEKMNIKFQVLGDKAFFEKGIAHFLEKIETQTKHHSGLNLILALNYGGQQEIVEGARGLIEKAKKGLVSSESFDKNAFHSILQSSQFPAPDLIIRTGGHRRLSNFYLWSSAYSEIVFKDTLWPDFNEEALKEEIDNFFTVRRNFGTLAKELR